MKRALLLAVSALLLTAFTPGEADAQGFRRQGMRPGVVARGPVIVRRGPVYGRRYYNPGLGAAAVGLGVLGAAAAVGAASAYPYGYDPCLRQQQVYDAWGYPQWTYVRVC